VVTAESNCEVLRRSAARIGGVVDESDGRGLLPGVFWFMRNSYEETLQRFCYAVSPLSLQAHRLTLPLPPTARP
jgi:predicted homoserine dehydrogenase-like protein